jgi:hypothetical protein
VPTLHNAYKPLEYSIHENILQLTGKACKESKAKFFTADQVTDLEPDYKSPTTKVFLYNLSKAIPDSIESCGEKLIMRIKDVVPSKTEYTYYSQDFSVFFPDSALFDTLYLTASKSQFRNSESLRVGDSMIPLLRDIKIEWKPSRQYDIQKFSVYRVSGGYSNLGGKWENGKVTFTTREFGEFAILKDTIAPDVARIACNQTYARFRVTDNLSGIYSFEASVNGNWLLMNYDYKTGIIMSERLDRKVPLKGDFQLKVTDYAGNEKIYKQKIL